MIIDYIRISAGVYGDLPLFWKYKMVYFCYILFSILLMGWNLDLKQVPDHCLESGTEHVKSIKKYPQK